MLCVCKHILLIFCYIDECCQGWLDFLAMFVNDAIHRLFIIHVMYRSGFKMKNSSLWFSSFIILPLTLLTSSAVQFLDITQLVTLLLRKCNIEIECVGFFFRNIDLYYLGTFGFFWV